MRFLDATVRIHMCAIMHIYGMNVHTYHVIQAHLAVRLKLLK